ncbi:MAG: cyclic nucleotide-binding domain-containing protein [Akkermansiaceae bacterium]|nr:cyclic nucleotide-binding domain-containing protein [Akkermansiaceae bacterium]MCP5551054.1 cyclic nucleotide-binding domain-containing protein [Akkermansiaceae bacterium]
MTTTLEPLLRQHPFFSAMDDETIRLITGCAKNVRFRAGDAIARQGEPADEFFLLREGHVALEMPAPQGGAVRLQTVDEGDVVGWSWLVPPYHWHFDLRAVSEVRAFSIDGRCLRRKCDSDPRFGYEMMKHFSVLMADRLEATRLQLLDLYRGPAAASNP